MIKCPQCSSYYELLNNGCPQCGFKPQEFGGFVSWAPNIMDSEKGYSKLFFNQLMDIESDNFWFCSRNKIIIELLQKYFPQLATFMEVGCGTGFVLSAVSNSFPKASITGSELLAEGLGIAVKRVKKANFIQMDGRNIPFRDTFDVIGAFDVLEHIEEDDTVLQQIFDAIKPGGGLIITVPQHPWLWSDSDEYARHVRRYKVGEIDRKIEAAGFNIIRSTSFVSLLIPCMVVSRLFKKKSKQGDMLSEFKLPRFLNGIFKLILTMERRLIMKGISFSFGGSRIIVAKRS